jgi:hypothetical protein
VKTDTKFQDARQAAAISGHDLVGTVREFKMKEAAIISKDTLPRLAIQDPARYPVIPERGMGVAWSR